MLDLTFSFVPLSLILLFFIYRLAEVFSARLEGEPVVRLQEREELFDQPAHAQWLPLLSLPEVLEGGHVS